MKMSAPGHDLKSGSDVQALINRRVARFPTGLKIFALLSLALLPLGMIMLFASLQLTRTADIERRAALRVATGESARRMGVEIAVDVATLRAASAALDSGQPAQGVCARTRSILSTAAGSPTGFALIDASGRVVCATISMVSAARPQNNRRARIVSMIDLDRSQLRIEVSSGASMHSGIAIYSLSQLAGTATPSQFSQAYRAELSKGGSTLTLVDNLHSGGLQRIEKIAMPVPQTALILAMSVQSVPLSSSQLLTMLLPLLMWAAAAAIGWLVVDRLILNPLASLRTALAAYRPGTPFSMADCPTTPAREIHELGETFRTITETVAAHEADLALGLSRQTRLTREVHHRVKNNLQVIASLINLHARGAKSIEAIAAFASIQRRVDALAVVYRNHYAELEENRGVAVRPMIGEIAASLRATAPPEAGAVTIFVEAIPVYVSQDVAVPLAFIITELVELAMLTDPSTTIRIAVSESAADGRSNLAILSPALADGRAIRARLAERHGRVLDGLARQLRAGLVVDQTSGSYAVEFPHVGIE